MYVCTSKLYKKTNPALTYSMVIDFCEDENIYDLMKAADLWNKNGTIGFTEALRRVKEN